MKTPIRRCSLILLVVLLIYLGIGIALLPHYRYQINSDGIAYITIAKLYLAGDWDLAINGMRSPLLSWLLVPLLALGWDPLQAAKILSLGISMVGFFCVHHFLLTLKTDRQWHAAALFTLIPVFLWMGFAVISPDFLVAVILLGYAQMVWLSDRSDGYRRTLFAGFLGGIAYWAKHYAFPFVVVHYTAHHLWRWWENRHDSVQRRVVIYKYTAGMILILLLSGAWMLAMQQKYGHFVVSYGGDYNFALMAPNHPGHAVEWKGLMAPPHPDAVSIWDDPFTLTMAPWHPLESVGNLLRYANIMRQFFSQLLEIWTHFSPFSHGLFLIALWLALSPANQDKNLRLFGRQIVPVVFIYCLGYLMTMTEERYYWFVAIILFYIAIYLGNVMRSSSKKDWLARAVLLIVLLSFAYFPTQNIVHHRGTGRQFVKTAEEIDHIINLSQKRIASNKNWHESLFLTYHLQGKYYGTCAPYRTGEQLRQALEQHHIEIFIQWGGTALPAAYTFLNDFTEVTRGRIAGMQIYDLTSRGNRPPQ